MRATWFQQKRKPDSQDVDNEQERVWSFSMISYAQNYEDVMLRRVFRDQKDGFYIDVGAMDPVEHSVTKFFYDQGWCGINIEPNEWFYKKLVEERPRDINLDVALGEREESRALYVFEQYGISTFDEASRDRFVDQGFEVKPRTVRVTTLAALCTDYVKRRIDFLKVDCEGWEEFVLKGADWDRFRPKVLIVEATEPGTATPSWSTWETFLRETARYEIVYFDGLNRYFVPREHSELRSHFEVAPNVFDDFTVYATEKAAYETGKAEQAGQLLKAERDRMAERLVLVEEKLNSTMAENQALSESLATRETEIHGTRISLDEAEQSKRDLQQARENLTGRVAELEAQAARDQNGISELEKERREVEMRLAQVDETLMKTRLWVGQLCQDLAASKRR